MKINIIVNYPIVIFQKKTIFSTVYTQGNYFLVSI